MTLLNDADAVYLGADPVDAVYAGTTKIWPSGVPSFSPADLANLTVWVDASGLTPGALASWPNLGSGGVGAIVGTPLPQVRAAILNGLPVVRFTVNEGRVRGTGMCVDGTFDLTVIYVARMVGPYVGRIFTNTYPPYNFLVGCHASQDEWLYDNGAVGGIGWPVVPTPWKMYGCVSTGTPRESRLYVNGVDKGMTGSSAGHDNRWNLSGYEATGLPETCDCEVAELVAYNRALPDDERIQVETYLRTKWGL